MGFAVYHPSQRWGPEDFDRGTDKIAASLANIPRQIFEGIQVGEERKMKERAMQDKEAQTQLARESMEQQGKYHEESLGLQRERMEKDDVRHTELLKMQKEQQDAQIKHLAKLDQKIDAQISQASKKGNVEQLARVYSYDKSMAERSAAFTMRTQPVFSNPQIESEFKSKISSASNPKDIVDLFQVYLEANKDKVNFIDRKAISTLGPMLRSINDSEYGYWKTQGIERPSQTYNDLSTFAITHEEYERNTKGLNLEDPTIATALKMLAPTDDKKDRFTAAIGAVVNKTKPSFINFSQEDYTKAKQALAYITAEMKKQKEEEKRQSILRMSEPGMRY